MRILVANTYVPLEPDRREVAAAGLTVALASLGHEAERVRIPFAEDPHTVVEQILALRLTDIAGDGDLMIAVGPRAHLLRHRRKRLWLGQDVACTHVAWRADPAGSPEPLAASLVRADRLGLLEAERVFAISSDECDRIWDFSGVAIEQLDDVRGAGSDDWARIAQALAE